MFPDSFKSIVFLLFFAVSTSLTGCSDQATPESVVVKFHSPDKQASLAAVQNAEHEGHVKNMSAPGILDFGLSDPQSVSEIDCFGVMVEYPEIPSQNFCTNESGQVIARPNALFGFFDFGSTGEGGVLAGSNRKFHIVTLNQAIGFCPEATSNLQPLEQNLSTPTIVGTETQDVVVGNNEIALEGVLATGSRLNNCEGPLFGEFGGDGFNPTELPDLVAWYDFTDVDTVFTDSSCSIPAVAQTNDRIGCILDKSAPESTKQAVSISDATRPVYKFDGINNRNAADFDGTTYLSATGVQQRSDGSVFIVFQQNSSNTTMIGSATSIPDNINSVTISGSSGISGVVTTDTLNSSTTGLSSSSPQMTVFTWESSGNGLKVYINSNSLDNSSTGSGFSSITTGFNYYIGGLNRNNGLFNAYTGKIAEIAVYNRELSAAEIQNLVDYSRQKWGTP